MKPKHWIMAGIFAVVASAGVYGYFEFVAPAATKSTSAATCEKHGISQCPFCSPEVIEQMGFCKGHGVPEAICTKCRDDLEAAFRAENDWCQGHGLPESQCEACNPGVLDKWKPQSESGAAAGALCEKHKISQCPFCSPKVIEEMGFCKGHGVPEAICTKCRDDLEAAFRAENDWCKEHGLPESQCEKCNPGVLDKWKDFSKPKKSVKAETPNAIGIAVARGDVARIHRLPSLTCTTEKSIVRFASPDVARSAGLEFASVQVSKLRKTLEAPAQLEYDARRHARLAPRAVGTVSEVRSELGQKVSTGDVLVVVDSGELGAAKSALLQAAARTNLWEKNSAREKLLLEKKLSTERDALEAETAFVESSIALQAAEQRLRLLGLTDAQVAEVQKSNDTSSLLYLSAPFSGVVVGLAAVVGERADQHSALVSVADTSRMWAMLDVDASDVRKVAVGQPVLLVVDGLEDQTLGGRVTWISTDVDRKTRTIKVRAEVANLEGVLRASGFGTGRIVTHDDREVVLVPKSAVQWEGCCNIAFVRRSETEFAPRKLLLGYDTGEFYEVLRGLEGGEDVVTQGSFLLKTELRKGSIGAGCCEVDQLSKK